MNSINTDDIFTDLPRPEPEATRFIDVHIYTLLDEDEQETRTIEATLDEISAANQPPDEDEPITQPSALQPGRKMSPILAVIVGVMLLALLGKGYFYLLPLLTPTTTITIVPVSKTVQVTQSVLIVAGATDSSKGQIAGRQLAAISLSQVQSVPTTGTAHQDAQPAHGTITFYNNAPYAQTIPTGMLLTGKSGVQYVTDQGATIAGAVYPTLGQAAVLAHSLTIGPSGNEPSGDIYGPCCLLNISAVSSAFTGGQEGRDYQTVSDQDISNVAGRLKASLATSASAALQTQLHQGETMLAPLCNASVTSDHKAGDEATRVSVSVQQQCSTLAYSTEALQQLLSTAVAREAQSQLGPDYTPMGDIVTAIKGQSQDSMGTVLSVQAQGTWYASWNDARLSVLAGKIAGKGKQEATRFLLHTAGIAQVEGLPDTLPADSGYIHVIVLYVPSGGK